VAIAAVEFFIVFLIKKQYYRVFKDFPYGEMLKYHGEKELEYIKGIFFFLFILIIIFLSFNYKEKLSFLTIIPLLYYWYYWYKFKNEYNTRIKSYDENGNYIYSGMEIRIHMPVADKNLGWK
jgi:Ca2+/Na+ antiporter